MTEDEPAGPIKPASWQLGFVGIKPVCTGTSKHKRLAEICYQTESVCLFLDGRGLVSPLLFLRSPQNWNDLPTPIRTPPPSKCRRRKTHLFKKRLASSSPSSSIILSLPPRRVLAVTFWAVWSLFGPDCFPGWGLNVQKERRLLRLRRRNVCAAGGGGDTSSIVLGRPPFVVKILINRYGKRSPRRNDRSHAAPR